MAATTMTRLWLRTDATDCSKVDWPPIYSTASSAPSRRLAIIDPCAAPSAESRSSLASLDDIAMVVMAITEAS